MLIPVWVSRLASSVLRNIGNDLHAAHNRTMWTTLPLTVIRSCWSSKSICQLLNEGAANVVGGDVDGIGDTENNE